MSEIVSLHHNEPMTTSLAIAKGVELQHKNVLELVHKYINELSEFGVVGTDILPAGHESELDSKNSAFQTAAKSINVEIETRNSRSTRGRPTEIVYLNEQQATLLITFMRNSPIVIQFKKALVRAFFEMRDRLQQMAPANPPFLTDNLSHGADLAVAADRTFRGFLRSARAAGLRLPAALRVANQQTLSRTGMDMLTELDIDPDEIPEAAPATEEDDDSPLRIALEQWAAGVVPGELYSLVDIIAAALSISPRDRHIRQYTVKAGPILRHLGFTKRKMQHHGRPLNLWFKP